MSDSTAIRPRSLEEFVGQSHLKEQIKRVVQAAKLVNEPIGHTLLTGPAGLGKSSMSHILALERGSDFVPIFSSSVRTINDLRELLRTKLDDTGYDRNDPNPKIPEAIKPTVLFFDEVHQLPRIVRESLYTVMEDRVYWDEEKSPWSGRKEIRKTWVPKFTLVAATTAEGVLEKPFLDRFENHWKFERYTVEECEEFVRRALNTSPAAIVTTDEVIRDIANRSRGTARVAINLTRSVINGAIGGLTKRSDKLTVNPAISSRVFTNMGIDEQGLGKTDYAILKYLVSCYRPCGVRAIATALEETPESIERLYEPFLVTKGLMLRTPQGRVISEAGVEFLRGKKLIPASSRRVIED